MQLFICVDNCYNNPPEIQRNIFQHKVQIKKLATQIQNNLYLYKYNV